MTTSGNGYLLDTGVANLLAVGNAAAQQQLALLQPTYIPGIAFGELQYGAFLYFHRHQSRKYLDLYDAFYRQYRRAILYTSPKTAPIYGAIFAELKSKGQLIQQNDAWIAALARQHRLTLLTRDRDYERIAGLAIVLF